MRFWQAGLAICRGAAQVVVCQALVQDRHGTDRRALEETAQHRASFTANTSGATQAYSARIRRSWSAKRAVGAPRMARSMSVSRAVSGLALEAGEAPRQVAMILLSDTESRN